MEKNASYLVSNSRAAGQHRPRLPERIGIKYPVYLPLVAERLGIFQVIEKHPG